MTPVSSTECDPERILKNRFLGRLNIMIGRTQGHLAATACVLIFGACSDPEERTDLRPSGAPEVLTVLVSNDAAGDGILEGATFCKLNDEKRPGLVPANPDGPAQVCPDTLSTGVDQVTDAVPVGWYVRVQFDELLNPDIEELLPIPDSDLLQGSLAKSQPVVVSCAGANVPYDGYYNPSGNSVTWPLGPSLFIQPLDDSTIPAGADCNLMIKGDVAADKDGEHVPAAQLGPYTFKIAPMDLVGTDPAPPRDATKPGTVAPEDPVLVTFNTRVDVATLTADEVTIREVADCADTAGTVRGAVIAPAEKDPTSIAISDDAAPGDASFEPEKTYVITFNANAQVSQAMVNGVTFDPPQAKDLTLCFKTGKLAPSP
jgi:hypothetical protein